MPRVVCADQSELAYCCGIKDWGTFYYTWQHDGDDKEWDDISFLTLGKSELACAAFIDTPYCQDAYEYLASKFNIVYQSKPRLNTGSGNLLFFVVYDGEKV